MIHSCTCSRGAASNSELPKQRRGSKACNSCGGEMVVNKRGANSKSMVSTVGSELSRAIDPQLTWKTASNGRQRAGRRARTSFPGVNKKNPAAECSKDSDNRSCGEHKIRGDPLVSESEKLGVSILGRHFSDTLEFVPIKKRKFMLFPSSSPFQSLSHSHDSNDIPENPSASHQETGSNILQITEVNSDLRPEQCRDKILANESAPLNGINVKLCDAADLSGISILAAAACDGHIDCDLSNDEDSVSKGPSFGGEGISRSLVRHSLSTEKAVPLPSTSETLDGEVDVHMGTSTISVLPCNGSDGNNAEALLSQGKVQSSSRCNRFHWDLNTEMDEWEILSDAVMDCQPLVSENVGGDRIHDGKLVNEKTYESQAEFVDTRVHMDIIPKNNHASQDSDEQEKPTSSCDTLAADHKGEKEDLFSPCKGGLTKNEHLLEDAAPMEEEKADAYHVMLCEDGFSKEEHGLEGAAVAMEGENASAHCVSVGLIVDADTSSSHETGFENVSIEQSTRVLESQPVVSENTYSAFETGAGKGNYCFDISQLGGILQTEKDVYGLKTGKIGQCLAVSDHLGEAFDAAVHGTCNRVMIIDCMSGKIAHADASIETTCDQDNRSLTVETSPHLPGLHPVTSQGSSNHDELSSGRASLVEVDMATDMEDCKSNVLPDKNMDATKSNHAAHAGSKVSVCTSEAMMPDICDGPLADGALSSHGTCKSSVGYYACRYGKANLENHMENDYDSDASHINTDCRIGAEKVELSGDDDSLYEDGELRESVMNSWGEYGAEEAEIEHVDYGSDNREADVFETAGCLASGVLHVDGVECKDAIFIDGGNAHYNGTQLDKKDVQDVVSQSFLQSSSMTDTSDDGSGKRSVGSIMKNVTRNKKLERNLKAASECGPGCHEVRRGDFRNAVAAKESNLRMKSSGWSQLLEGCQNSGDGVTDARIDSANLGNVGGQLDASSAGEFLKRIGGSAPQRELPSRIEKPDSSNVPCSKDKFFARASRHSGETNDQNPKFGGDSRTPISFGRIGSSLHMHGRGRVKGRGDRWADSSLYWGPNSHDASVYYGPGNFSHRGSRNAVAEAAAKVESNGFVVAPDGTLVKSGGGPVERGHGRSVDGFSRGTRHPVTRRDSPLERDGASSVAPRFRNLRESPDRDINLYSRMGRYGLGMIRTGQRERYRGTLRDKTDSQLSIQRPSSMREQSFSTRHRRPFHSSQSPSRSRSHSPHTWRSPRGRNECGVDGDPVLWQCTRSPPNFRYEARLERIRSPHRRIGTDRMIAYGPLSRNSTSPPQVSSLFDGRDELPYRIREHAYRHPSGRNPTRVFSQNNMFDSMDSSGRLRQGEFYQPIHARRSPDFVGVGRSSRHDRANDRRGHGNRSGISHSPRQHDVNGNMRGFDVGDGFWGHTSRTKISPVFQRRGSPRGLERGIDSQHGASPERVREENNHHIDGKDNSGFK